MELLFKPKAQSGWRGRGAPSREVPANILDVLRHTEDSGEVGVIDTTDVTPQEIIELLAVLRAGGRKLGTRTRLQRDEDKHEIRFMLAPRSRSAT